MHSLSRMSQAMTRAACAVDVSPLTGLFEPRFLRDLIVETADGRVSLMHVPMDWQIRSSNADVRTAEPLSAFRIELPDALSDKASDGSVVITVNEFDVASKLVEFGGKTMRLEERDDDVLLEGGGVKWSATKGKQIDTARLLPVTPEAADVTYRFYNGMWARRFVDALGCIAQAVGPTSMSDTGSLVSVIQIHGESGGRSIRIGASDQYAYAVSVQGSSPDEEAGTSTLPDGIGPVLVCPMEAAAFARSLDKHNYHSESRLTILCAADRVTFRVEDEYRRIVRSLTATRGSIPQLTARHGGHGAANEVVYASRQVLTRLCKEFPVLKIEASDRAVLISDGGSPNDAQAMQVRLSHRSEGRPAVRPSVIDSGKLFRCLKACRNAPDVRLGLPTRKSDPLTISGVSDLWHADVFCAAMTMSAPEHQ